jgi:hypothetical protein
MRQQAYLIKGLRISVIDAREQIPTFGSDEELFYIRDTGIDAPSHTFFFEGGLISCLSSRPTNYSGRRLPAIVSR